MMDIPKDLQVIIHKYPHNLIEIVEVYLNELYYQDVMCELKQRFLHEKLMKEIFYNSSRIIKRYVYRFGFARLFETTGEEHLYDFGYGDNRYMEYYCYRFYHKRLSNNQMLNFHAYSI